MPERFEQESRPNDPEWVISELRTLVARWSEVDAKRPIGKADLQAKTAPPDLPVPDQEELRRRESKVVQEVLRGVETGIFTGEQKERLIIALKEAEQHFDDDRVISQLADLRDLLEFGPRELP